MQSVHPDINVPRVSVAAHLQGDGSRAFGILLGMTVVTLPLTQKVVRGADV